MWWNIRNFSSNSRTDQELSFIAQVITGMDVVAIGELEDPNVLPRLTTLLGPSWEHAHSPEVGNTPGTSEHYGYVWNGSVLEMVGQVQNYPDPGNRIDREPAYATFRHVDGTLDFTVIAIHVTWGRTVGGRREEIRVLPDVWNHVQDDTADDDDMILVGDFNRSIGDRAFDHLLGLPGLIRANEDTGPTHISSMSTYDQVFLSTQTTSEWTGNWNTVRFDETLFADNDQAANLAASDHRPVWISLQASVDDDP